MLRAATTSSIGNRPGPRVQSSASSTRLVRSSISGMASVTLSPSTTLYRSDLSRTCRSMSGRPLERSSDSTDWQYFSHSSALRKFGWSATPFFQKSVVIPHHFPHSFVEARPRVEARHADAQRLLTITVLGLSPGEQVGDFVSVVLWLTGFDNDAVFEDAFVDAAGSGGDRNAPGGDCFEVGSHLAITACRDVGPAPPDDHGPRSQSRRAGSRFRFGGALADRVRNRQPA